MPTAAPERSSGDEEILVSRVSHGLMSLVTRSLRRHLVGSLQGWSFEPPAPEWRPPHADRTALYLHVPFCRSCCPYCPYTKVPYDEALVGPYTTAAVAEVDRWADAIGPASIASVYVGGGTPTHALDGVAQVLARVRTRFRVEGDICVETSPSDITGETVRRLNDLGVGLVSLGVQSFQSRQLRTIGRRYDSATAERALMLLARGGFQSVNADIMFAIPGQTEDEVIADLARAAELGANQLTTYPLFTFPYTSIGQYLRLNEVHMPNLVGRHRQYRAICQWSRDHGYQRVSVWSFKRGDGPRYSSVTRDGYIGIGPGAGSHLADGFVLNTFDLSAWIESLNAGRSPIALRMPFTGQMQGWWWLYWRFYDTRVPLDVLGEAFGSDANKARRVLKSIALAGLGRRNGSAFELTDRGAFWVHLLQNYFALSYVNAVWTIARQTAWPHSVQI
jgi:coproporphyrinogen III oxidase-like Fe-S oxidoreductase